MMLESEARENIVHVDGDGVPYLMWLPARETDYIQSGIARSRQPYEQEMLRDMSRRLASGDNVVDVGANIGNHTIYLAAVVNCNVDAVEPDESLVQAIRRSAELNGIETLVNLHATALGSLATRGNLVRTDESNIGAQRVELDCLGGKEVAVQPLDRLDIRRPVRALKIDVEGMEIEVLKGAQGVVAEDRPLIYVESATRQHFEQVSRLLTDWGYVCWDVFNSTPTHLFIPGAEITDVAASSQVLLKTAKDAYTMSDELRIALGRLADSNLKYREITRAHAIVQAENVRLKQDASTGDAVDPRSELRWERLSYKLRTETAKVLQLQRQLSALRRRNRSIERALGALQDERVRRLDRTREMQIRARNQTRHTMRTKRRADATDRALAREIERVTCLTETIASLRRDAATRDLELIEKSDRVRQVANLYRDAIAEVREGTLREAASRELASSRLESLESLHCDRFTELERANELAALKASQEYDKLLRSMELAKTALRRERERSAATTRKLARAAEGQRESQLDAEKVRASVTYLVGKLIRNAIRSPQKAARLPIDLLKLSRSAGAAPKATISDENTQDLEATARASDIVTTSSAGAPRSGLRMAVIVDPFTASSLAPEAHLIHLSPQNWEAELEAGSPDLLFIESAWRGHKGLWHNTVSEMGAELRGIVEWCALRSIPTVFWNKEDPVHYTTFINAAAFFDVVFTTDIDCVARYKAELGHDRVYLLPFASQPSVHNPMLSRSRQDAIAFAGAYYRRYPERNRDLDSFLSCLRSLKTIDIYDRNLNSSDEDYKFPAAYESFIAGTLSPAEIDVAYKGYEYAINLNSVKQSQTMFARRVFELLASGTTVVSNFSRGVRLLFGDLVVTTDDGQEARIRLAELDKVPDRRDRLRLQALRKVLKEHTYEHRVSYIAERALGRATAKPMPSITVLCAPEDAEELALVLAHVRRQHTGATLDAVLVVSDSLRRLVPKWVRVLSFEEAEQLTVAQVATTDFIAPMIAEDYYGPNYIEDLLLATKYATVTAYGKEARYCLDEGQLVLASAESEYSLVESLPMRSSIIRSESCQDGNLRSWLRSVPGERFAAASAVSLDRFSYCFAGGRSNDDAALAVDDLPIDSGADLAALQEIAQASKADDFDAETLTALSTPEISGLFSNSRSSSIQHEIRGGEWWVSSNLDDGAHDYLYAGRTIPVSELWTGETAQVYIDCGTGLNLQFVFIFHDSESQRIEAFFALPRKNAAFPIPAGAVAVKVGVRVKGPGEVGVKAVVLDEVRTDNQDAILPSELLVISNNYPSYDDLYRNGFVHSRVLSYMRMGRSVDVFRVRPGQSMSFGEFQGVDVLTGSVDALGRAIGANCHAALLVHFLDEGMWNTIRSVTGRRRVVIWMHGAEVRPWWRLRHNYDGGVAPEAVQAQSQSRIEFWRSVFQEADSMVHFVFISQRFAREVMEDLNIDLDPSRYSIIHNPIDVETFEYVPKTAADRLKILSLRPFASNTYANDLTVRAILDLSNEPWFGELQFDIVGDGPLFEETVRPILEFSNVALHRRFLTRQEIAAMHRTSGVFMVPTRIDSQGVSRDEAMSSGLVPITCNVSAVTEFVDDQSGMVVGPEDWKGLANSVRTLRNDPDLFMRLSEAAASRVRRQSASDIIAMRELAVIGGAKSATSSDGQ